MDKRVQKVCDLVAELRETLGKSSGGWQSQSATLPLLVRLEAAATRLPSQKLRDMIEAVPRETSSRMDSIGHADGAALALCDWLEVTLEVVGEDPNEWDAGHQIAAAVPRRSAETRERNMLLKIFIGLAAHHYQFSPAGPPVAAKIRTDLEIIGINVDDDTLRKYLTEGAEYLPSRIR